MYVNFETFRDTLCLYFRKIIEELVCSLNTQIVYNYDIELEEGSRCPVLYILLVFVKLNNLSRYPVSGLGHYYLPLLSVSLQDIVVTRADAKCILRKHLIITLYTNI